MTKRKKIRQYARIRMIDEWMSPEMFEHAKYYPFYHHYRGEKHEWDPNRDVFLYFLGEIPNMRGHCILTSDRGDIFAGYHIENFEEIPEDE